MADEPDITVRRGYLGAVCLLNVGVYCAAVILGLLGPSPKYIGHLIILAWIANIVLGALALPVAMALRDRTSPTRRRSMADEIALSVPIAALASTLFGIGTFVVFYGLLPAIVRALPATPP